VRSIAKCLGSAWPGCGKSSSKIAEPETCLKRGAADKVVQKSGVETVAGADGVDRIDKNRYSVDFPLPAARDCALLASLHYYERNAFCENAQRSFRVVALRKMARFTFVGQ